MCQLSILQCAAIFWALLPLLTQQGLSLPELYLIECRPEGLTYAYAMDNAVEKKRKARLWNVRDIFKCKHWTT